MVFCFGWKKQIHQIKGRNPQKGKMRITVCSTQSNRDTVETDNQTCSITFCLQTSQTPSFIQCLSVLKSWAPLVRNPLKSHQRGAFLAFSWKPDRRNASVLCSPLCPPCSCREALVSQHQACLQHPPQTGQQAGAHGATRWPGECHSTTAPPQNTLLSEFTASVFPT